MKGTKKYVTLPIIYGVHVILVVVNHLFLGFRFLDEHVLDGNVRLCNVIEVLLLDRALDETRFC